MTFLMGVFVKAPSPTLATAAQNPIFASMRANSSAEKLTCMPKKSMPGYSLLASANVGPHKCIMPRFANTTHWPVAPKDRRWRKQGRREVRRKSIARHLDCFPYAVAHDYRR